MTEQAGDHGTQQIEAENQEFEATWTTAGLPGIHNKIVKEIFRV